ncbi:MAG TPA: acyl-CoA dehydrogenase [Cyanobacteria bacterium UBA8803]|nr:acyl-CoA dehydrogenase [Cyanobacteria bacterium UBA9273]HBL58353.1 acyl-CoA dehydrogenase [Cyanobacteria bacterium UBA8803]
MKLFEEGDNPQMLLDLTESYLKESVGPVASAIDSDPEALRDAIKGMGDRSLLALKVPLIWGGTDIEEVSYRRFQQMIPRYSGALAFLQTQHQSAGELLARSDNQLLKQYYLPRMGQGQVLVGIGFSQVRRSGDPPVQALPVAGGYQVRGTVPWVTGFSFFEDFILGAVLPDGREVYGMVPFVEKRQVAGGAIAFSDPMELAAMTSTNTVSATLTDWFLPEEQVLFIRKAGAIHENDKKNVLNHGFFALGCARAGLDILEAAAKTKQLSFIQLAFDSLNEELTRCESAFIQALPPNSQSWEERLQLRAWAINLAGRCAHAAVTVSSGGANYKHHPAQRVYREVLVFTVSGQTIAVMAATLAQLVLS